MVKKEFSKIISPSGDDRLRIKIEIERGKDVMLPGGKKEKYPLDIPDLKIALLYAEQDIKDRWKWYRDRYRKRLKK